MAMDYEDARTGLPLNDAQLNDSSNIVPEIAAAAAVAASGAIPLIADAGNVVTLPPGASLDDIQVRGRDLIIEMPDGRVFVIADGAIFVPIIMVEGVAIPPLNLATLNPVSVTNRFAIAHQRLAIGVFASSSCAAAYSIMRAACVSVSMSASLNWLAWNSAIA